MSMYGVQVCKPRAGRSKRPAKGGTAGRAALFLVACLLALVVSSQPRWTLNVFDSRNGMPQNSVLGMAMDTAGYLWLATEDGLVRSDGIMLDRVLWHAPDRLSAGRMRHFSFTRTGDLFVTDASEHLFQVSAGQGLTYITTMDPAKRPPRGEVPNTELLVRMHDRKHPLPGAENWNDRSISLSAHDMLVPGIYGAVCFYHDTLLTDSVQAGDSWSRPVRLGGGIFLIGHWGVPYRVDPATHAITPFPLAGEGAARCTAGDEREIYWHRTDADALVRVGDDLLRLSYSPGDTALTLEPLNITLPPGCAVNDALIGPDGSLVAVGTAARGLFLYRRDLFRTLSCSGGAGSDNDSFYAQVAMGPDSLLALDRGLRHAFGPHGCGDLPSGSAANSRALVRGPGSIIYGAHIDTLLAFAGPDLQRRVLAATGDMIHCLLVDDDRVWVGGDHRIGYFENGRYTFLLPLDLSANNETYCLRKTADGLIWVGTTGGLFHFDPHGPVRLERVPELAGRCVRSVELIGDRMFVGTDGDGAFASYRGRFVPLPLDDDQRLLHAHTFMPDEHGWIWISTNNGIFRVRHTDIDAYLDGRIPRVYLAHYGTEAGIANPELNGGCDPAYLRLANGLASFPSLQGLVWFHPDQVPDPTPQGTVLFESFTSGQRTWPVDGPVELGTGVGNTSLHFSCPYWGLPENFQLEYQITGMGDAWIPLGPQQRDLLFIPTPGEHEVLIRPVGLAGARPEAVSRLAFSVAYPFYRTFAGISLMALGAAGLFVLALRYNSRRLRQRNDLLERAVRQRTSQLQQANTHLERSVQEKERLVSIISHDIVSPLQFIARVAKRHGGKEAPPDRSAWQDIASTSEKLHANAQNMLNWIRHQERGGLLRPRHLPMHQVADNVLGLLREQAVQKGIRLENLVPQDDIFRSDHEVISTILHNLVGNALGHARPHQVTISGRGGELDYVLEVQDDGAGMDAAALDKIRLLLRDGTNENDPFSGLGYIIVRDMLKLLGASITIDSTPDQGTSVVVTIPAER